MIGNRKIKISYNLKWTKVHESNPIHTRGLESFEWNSISKKKVSERQPDSKGSLQRENAGSKTDEREMQVRKGAEVCLKNPHRMGIWQMMEGQF